jgi:hypothetical protein
MMHEQLANIVRRLESAETHLRRIARDTPDERWAVRRSRRGRRDPARVSARGAPGPDCGSATGPRRYRFTVAIPPSM